MVIQLLLEDGVAENLSYDYETKQILLNGEPMQVKLESMVFTTIHPCEVSPEIYKDACWFWAMQNTPKPEPELDALSEKIVDYISDKKEFTTTDIIEECLTLKLADTRTKSLEMKIARLLKERGYIKKRTNSHRYWTKK